MSKKRKNWLEKFQEFWWDDLTSLQRRCLWDVLATIRGPDKDLICSCSVKKATTARIRYLLLGRKPSDRDSLDWIYGFVRQKSIPITEKQLRSLGYHFYDHIYRAISRLKNVVKASEIKDLLKIFGADNESNTKS